MCRLFTIQMCVWCTTAGNKNAYVLFCSINIFISLRYGCNTPVYFKCLCQLFDGETFRNVFLLWSNDFQNFFEIKSFSAFQTRYDNCLNLHIYGMYFKLFYFVFERSDESIGFFFLSVNDLSTRTLVPIFKYFPKAF